MNTFVIKEFEAFLEKKKQTNFLCLICYVGKTLPYDLNPSFLHFLTPCSLTNTGSTPSMRTPWPLIDIGRMLPTLSMYVMILSNSTTIREVNGWCDLPIFKRHLIVDCSCWPYEPNTTCPGEMTCHIILCLLLVIGWTTKSLQVIAHLSYCLNKILF